MSSKRDKKNETLNNILKNSPMKKVDETWVHPITGKETPLLVRGTRLCPYCHGLVQVTLEKKACKNGYCPMCEKWFCLRCLHKVSWAGDHETCCRLHHEHFGPEKYVINYHWCKEKGLQQKKGRKIIHEKDFLANNFNWKPKEIKGAS